MTSATALPLVTPSPLELVLARGRVRAMATMLGPAFVAAIAYVDPGNFATNFSGGAQFGYQLMWVVLLANLVAMPIQYLSAKLGIVTGQSLPALCRERMPRAARWGMWLQAELVAMSTDLAEFVGAAIGLNLLFDVPLPVAGVITAVVAFAIMGLQTRGYRHFEVAIGAMLALICAGFLYQVLEIGPSASGSLAGFMPSVQGQDGVLLAVGIIGATVMPHAIYLHSGLTSKRVPARNAGERRQLLRFERIDIVIALGIAGLVNMSMLALSAELFHTPGGGSIDIAGVHAGLGELVGGGAALAFAVALFASGIASASVGTCAGQIVMDGFLKRSVPMVVRRGVTMVPALALLCSGINPTEALVLSQVVLSFGIPFALFPLVALTSSRSLMGEHVNRWGTTLFVGGAAVALSGLNVLLLVLELG